MKYTVWNVSPGALSPKLMASVDVLGLKAQPHEHIGGTKGAAHPHDCRLTQAKHLEACCSLGQALW